jgi:hypothetical protein
VRYGFKDLLQGPDVVAFEGDNSVLYGECTVALPDDSKIQQVRSGAEAFKRVMAERFGRAMFMARVVFCSQRRPPGLEDWLAKIYEEDRVAVAFAEDLEELLEGAIRGEAPGTLMMTIATAGKADLAPTHVF